MYSHWQIVIRGNDKGCNNMPQAQINLAQQTLQLMNLYE
jgi:hypothetical protein